MSVVSGDGELTGAVDEMEVYLGEYDRQFVRRKGTSDGGTYECVK
ncbi:hypothetical protein PI125_g11394 [Phytophthora idaei]|nr:hypothetical protein PI125_g11394 [Phytophthora idaei]KAG3138945.1 hypothetical protein PI126_g16690 [Phytophthora idaei]